MKREVLKVQGLEVAYGEKKIINGLDFSVYKGEFVGIIGPNGTGKSTLVKAITDIIPKSSGSIRILDHESTSISKKELAKLVAVVPQEFNIEYEFTNLDIVMMGRNPHIDRKHKKSSKDFEIVQEAMEMTNTWRFKDSLFNELSGGERQRVVVARAIAQQTNLILLDEPTSHLDVHHQLEIMELIHKLKESRGVTVVAILHDINLAARFSDRLILLNKGKVLAEGSPDKVIHEKYLTQLYKMEMIIRENKIIGKREIVPLRVIKEKVDKQDIRVHILCGGGSGEEILERFNSLGMILSAGILNKGDSDWEMCKILNIPVVDAPPFSAMTKEQGQLNLEMLNRADYVLISNMPYGNGNLINLEILRDVDKPIYFIEKNEQYDYTDGKATKIINELKKKENFYIIDHYEKFLSNFNLESKR